MDEQREFSFKPDSATASEAPDSPKPMPAAVQPVSNVTELAASSEAIPSSNDNMPPPPPKLRKKVPYEKGYSQMDWLRLSSTHPDLAGLNGATHRRLISIDEVKQHKHENDAWTVLRGRVYNITPYMKFHPGGVDMLKKAAGRDCTKLFNKYHAWVNADVLLEKCLVGALDAS